MPYDISGLIGAAYGLFPGGASTLERDLGFGYAPTGGGGQPQNFLGPEFAGRLGTGAGPGRGDYMGGTGGVPRGMGVSPFPGSSYRTRDNAPQYHQQIPMGGTPGVYAIRNDEIYGPKDDGLLDMWREKSKRSGRYRTGGRRRRRR